MHPRNRSRSCMPLLLSLLLVLSFGCASTDGAEAEVPDALKRRVAVLGFGNETDFATGAFEGSYGEPLEEQTAEILEARLVASGQVVLVDGEGFLADGSDLRGLAADYVLAGALTEFGRSTTTKTRIIRSTKRQSAHAKLRVRLIETRTGQVVYVGSGSSQVAVQNSRLFGMGKEAPFNEELTGEALTSATVELVDRLIEHMLNQPWLTHVISVDGSRIIVAGGNEQGLRPGLELSVKRRGPLAPNPQAEGLIELPRREVARLEVVSFFGAGPHGQGAVCKLLDGALGGQNLHELVVEALP